MERKKIKVYRFTRYDFASKIEKLSARAGTLEAIASISGKPFLDTAYEVNEWELDTKGFVLALPK
jgi:hypothetical protein